jgi:hypothetical protein
MDFRANKFIPQEGSEFLQNCTEIQLVNENYLVISRVWRRGFYGYLWVNII